VKFEFMLGDVEVYSDPNIPNGAKVFWQAKAWEAATRMDRTWDRYQRVIDLVKDLIPSDTLVLLIKELDAFDTASKREILAAGNKR
jgi:hypothetical protein